MTTNDNSRLARPDRGPAPLLLHVGYVKTASTWLQRCLFDHPEAGMCIPWPDSRARAISAFRIVNPFRFDPAVVRARFEPDRVRAVDRGLVPVLSDETFSGNPLRWYFDAQTTADRLHAVFPQARVLICIREQRGLVRSLYHEYIKHGGDQTLASFLERPSVPGRGPVCDLDHFEFDRLIAYYQSLFGRDHVLVLPFEWLHADRKRFVERILHFAGVDGDAEISELVVNKGARGAAIALRRVLNRWSADVDYTRPRQPLSARIASRVSRAADRLVPESIPTRFERRMKRQVESALKGLYAESNRRTERLIGASLEPLGYECG